MHVLDNCIKKRKFDSITPTLRDDLHWLPVRQRVDLKIFLLVYKRLHQLAAPYLVSLLTLLTAISARRLRISVIWPHRGRGLWTSVLEASQQRRTV